MTAATRSERIAAARHARAIALLPLTNTIAIPGVLLLLWPPTYPLQLTTALAGCALAGTGAALVVHCVRLFVRFGCGTLAPWDPTRVLLSAGAYRYSRNPMKTGLFLVLGGEALAAGSVALTAWLACFAIVNVVYIQFHEEPGLLKRFGVRYAEYCDRVPRWWPTLRSLRSSEVR
jgi:protein-S-isoprenylcysteine O-methyltransferase Ste14